MSLPLLPEELVLQIMRHLRDSQDSQALKSAACACSWLRRAAEVFLYSTAKFTTLSSLYQYEHAIQAEPQRVLYLRDLQLLYSTGAYDYHRPPSPLDLTSFTNLESFVSESPECQPFAVKGTHWNVFMDSYMQAFHQASLLTRSLEDWAPLRKLRAVTLHWSGSRDRFWDITPKCPIFLLPLLQSLEISCARVGQEESDEWKAEELVRFRRQTRLKSLVLTECVISIEALLAILSFPAALTTLILREKFYHHREIGDRFAVEDTDAFNRAIAQQARSLEHLEILRHSHFAGAGKTLVLSLDGFPVLSHLQLGPYLSTRQDGTRYFTFAIATPVPEALESLRLDEYRVSMLKDPYADKVLSDLSVAELLTNAKDRGRPFTLDISLGHLPSLFSRIVFDAQDARPAVRNLVENFVSRFQQRQAASIRASPEAISIGASNNTASSRLRFLTNKPRHKVPPFLHNEGPQRYVVRYDSQYPERFLSHPYTANALPPDRVDSSDDEDMDVAFSGIGIVDHRLLT
ncbi:hypothetical protein F5Y05DRAFT_414201 [Hypoxylon sp. FL0543]|nr:hypothetical protein F5Y05DRAFT_414201 [Hypoxylon sp. FL0543]